MLEVNLYRNPSLGLATNVRGCKVVGQEGDPKVTSHTLKIGSWSLKWTPKFLKRNRRVKTHPLEDFFISFESY